MNKIQDDTPKRFHNGISASLGVLGIFLCLLGNIYLRGIMPASMR